MRIEYWEDLYYAVTFQPAVYDDFVVGIDVKVYLLHGELADGTWLVDDGFCNPVRLEDATMPEVEGQVKWDGCSNWGFPVFADGGLMHFCGHQDIMDFGMVLERAVRVAYEMLPEKHADIRYLDGLWRVKEGFRTCGGRCPCHRNEGVGNVCGGCCLMFQASRAHTRFVHREPIKHEEETLP